jgi:hypothetical protein
MGIVAQGTDRVRELVGETHKYGLVLSDEMIEVLDSAKDKQELWNQQLLVFQGRLAVVAGPLIEKWITGAQAIAEWLGKVVGENTNIVTTADKLSLLNTQINALGKSIEGAKKSDFSQTFDMGDGSMFQGSIDKAIKKLKELKTARDALMPKAQKTTPDDFDKDKKEKLIEGKDALGPDLEYLKEKKSIQKAEEKAGEEHEEAMYADARVSWEKQQKLFDEKEEGMKRTVDMDVSLGQEVGYAIAAGIEEGNYNIGKALSGTLVVFLDFLERWMIASITQNTLARFGQAGVAGLLVGGASLEAEEFSKLAL